MVIAVIAIIFVGPKDLPGMLRQFGRFSRKARGMASEFQKQVDDALRESELDSVRDTLNDVKRLDPRQAVKDRLNPLKAEIEADPNARPQQPDTAKGSDETPVFDEDAGPTPAAPVKVDVEAALARQAELDAAASEPATAKKPRKKPAATATPKKSIAKKPAARKTSSKPRATAKKRADEVAPTTKADA